MEKALKKCKSEKYRKGPHSLAICASMSRYLSLGSAWIFSNHLCRQWCWETPSWRDSPFQSWTLNWQEILLQIGSSLKLEMGRVEIPRFSCMVKYFRLYWSSLPTIVASRHIVLRRSFWALVPGVGPCVWFGASDSRPGFPCPEWCLKVFVRRTLDGCLPFVLAIGKVFLV